MRKLDWYTLTEFAGPFVFGVGVFFLLLVGITLLPDALKMMVREKVPWAVGTQVILYRVPMLLALTVPMAAMFASLMCFSRLSGDGEVVAMRCAGVPVHTIVRAVLAAGAIISAVMCLLSHSLAPASNHRARRILDEYRKLERGTQHVVLRIPSQGMPERVVYITELDLRAREVRGLWILEFRDGQPWQSLFAKRGYWDGKDWVLEKVEHSRMTQEGLRTERIQRVSFDLGRTPEDLERIEFGTDELTTAELLRELEVAEQRKPRDWARGAEIRMEIAGRWAVPWAVLGFAMVGAVLGIRPHRTTRGVALGVSLAIILVYYLVLHTMSILAEQGKLPAALCAWTPNAALYAVGLAGLLSSDK
ncbi:MAG: LptF/LptG family permease [Armatimonadetes bacterium]|nr:LptF/LptG family permease [Armatimonadota bacterium]